MSNYHFEQVTTWEGAKQTHRRFVEDYNHQPHWGHRKRDDNRHTPAEVLGWVTGKMRSPEQLHRIFYATRFLRFLDRFGYARFRSFRLFAEAGLARRQSVLWLYGDTLTLEYANAPLSQYTVDYQPDKKHFRRERESHVTSRRRINPRSSLCGNQMLSNGTRHSDYQIMLRVGSASIKKATCNLPCWMMSNLVKLNG
jgi:hypothetical protein